jgi:FtsH-like protein
VLEARALCDTCGHTRDWHDRDAVRARLRTDPPIERPCYREVGGAPCRCGGFRESGSFAVPAGSQGALGPAPRSRLLQSGILTLLLVVMGFLLLYAYRSQTPAVPEVDVTRALADINSGQVRAVTIAGSKATLVFKTGATERTTVPQPDTIVGRAVADYNAAHPSQPIELTYESDTQPVSVVGSIILSLLPVLLIGGFFYYVMMRARRES